MKFELHDEVKHLFILGAGASIEYGLPGWSDLAILLRERLDMKLGAENPLRNELLDWLNKVGVKYDTIDECIAQESRSTEYHDNGAHVEEALFCEIRVILEEKYTYNNQGWIRFLNDAIINNYGIRNEIAIINYNYDDVLDRNLLDFSHLGQKARMVDYVNRLESLSNIVVDCFHPHGHFDGFRSKNINKSRDTTKTGIDDFTDVVSCFDSKKHSVRLPIITVAGAHGFPEKRQPDTQMKVYILGLGGGLSINLQKMKFNLNISEVHVTDHGGKRKKEILEILSKEMGVSIEQIHIYEDCIGLVNSAF